MPPTLEVAYANEACDLDMFELHYTYELVGEVTVSDLICPCCGQTEPLAELSYTYEDVDDRHP